ncbi:dTDP-4-amino-4,6-dideoxygalactose transaminase [Amylibacter sp.]|nr:dTDP-4-amino-4,6-dideoxygalactose transaminase [Amylibacter sp.]
MLTGKNIPFCKQYVSEESKQYVIDSFDLDKQSGNGKFCKLSEKWLCDFTGCKEAILTPSCTAALEMVAHLLDIKPGDEVILPSYTFVSSALAFTTLGAKPIFVDIDPHTLMIDPSLVEAVITKKTKAIIIVDYAGIPAPYEEINRCAKGYGIPVVQDAAQSIRSELNGKKVGSYADFVTFSFHDTKNISCGEGGALLLNNKKYINKARIIQEKGTNRHSFNLGKINKYSWVGSGSSYLMNEITAAYLLGNLQNSKLITKKRMEIVAEYEQVFKELIPEYLFEDIQLPCYANNSLSNGHMFYFLLNNKFCRKTFLKIMNDQKVGCVFHYVPLHTSEFIQKKGLFQPHLKHTDDISSRIVRFPLWIGVENYIPVIAQAVIKSLEKCKKSA